MYSKTYDYDIIRGKYYEPKNVSNELNEQDKKCDWKTYAVRYPDLMDTIGPYTEHMKYHYNKEGLKQGLDCSPDPELWDCKSYIQRYYWLDFGYDCDAAFKHYVNEGRFGERNPAQKECYELYGNSPNGKVWIRAPDRNPKNICQLFDSCKPGGGNMDRDKHRCFKWANGPDAKGDRWNGTYLISKPNNINCIDSNANGTKKLSQSMCNPTDKDQQFTLKFVDDDKFVLYNDNSNSCVSVGDGSKFHLTTCNPTDNRQIFSIGYADPYTAIKSNFNNKCISDNNNQRFNSNFKNYSLTDCINRDSNQHYNFVPIDKSQNSW